MVDYITLGVERSLRLRAVRGLRLSCSVNNPFTFTAYSGLTPMINSHAVNASIGLDDKRSYPRVSYLLDGGKSSVLKPP